MSALHELDPAEKLRVEALLGELATVLREEFAALKGRDVAALTEVVARKTQLIADLDTASGNICRSGGGLGKRWPELGRLAAQCAQVNRVNGGAIALNHGLVSGLLDTLHGSRRTAPTYTAGGKLLRRDSRRQVGYV